MKIGNLARWARGAIVGVMLASVATPVSGIGLTRALAEDAIVAEESVATEAAQDVDASVGAGAQGGTPGLQVFDCEETPATQSATEEAAQASVTIVEGDGEEATVSDWTLITSETTALKDGAYLVDSDTSIEGDLEVSGDVSLIVGHALRVNGSIHVPADATLRIYLKKDGSKDRSWVYGRGSKPCIVNEGTTEIHGAAVVGGRATHGVDNFGTLVMYGGEITGCSQDGVHNEKGAKFKLFGGSIYDNSGSGFVGEGTVFVSGSPVVKDNKKGNVVLNKQTNQTIFVEGVLRSGAHIGVTTQTRNRFTSGFAKYNASDDPAKYFFPDVEGTGTWDSAGEVIFADLTGTIAYLDAKDRVGHIPADKCQELSSLGASPKLQNGWYIVSKDTVVDKRIEVEGIAHLILGDGAKLTAKSGIHVCKARGISIYCQEGRTGELYCEGKGSDSEAGIGGNDEETGSLISIYGGKIYAKGGGDAAGIGGGCDANGNYIEIYGGEVTATSGTNGAGIGGGNNGDGGNIDIYGGKVQVYHRDGAGIGGGEDGDGGKINIYGGDIHSDYEGQGNGAGIGGGNHGGDGGRITISGGKVDTTSNHGAGIGGGRADDTWGASYSGKGGTIAITGGTVHAMAKHGYGIGAGDGSADQRPIDLSWVNYAGDITVSGTADVTATGYKAGIGGSNGTLTVKGGTTTARGSEGDKGGGGIRFCDTEASGNSQQVMYYGAVKVYGGALHVQTSSLLYTQWFNSRFGAAIDAGQYCFEGGTVEVESTGPCITAPSGFVAKGPGTMLRLKSDKGMAVDKGDDLENYKDWNIGVEDGASFEASSAKATNVLFYKPGDGIVVKAGPSKEEATERATNAKGFVTPEKEYTYVYMGPADK